MIGRFLGYLLTAAFLASGPAASAADSLSIGSPAPALDIEHWVQDGKGKFKKVTKFEAGKVYVVEFWATWCGPCKMSMPHLVELQKKYTDKGLQIISVTEEDRDEVEGFLKTEIRGGPKDGPKTWGELTSAYCLTADPDSSTYESYMNAIGDDTLPTAFIVGKDGKIEWIGRPLGMDQALEQVINDKWDRAKFAEQFKSQKEIEQMVVQAENFLQRQEFKKALALIEKAIERSLDTEQQMKLRLIRMEVSTQVKELKPKLPEIITETFQAIKAEPELVGEAAWTLTSMMENGFLEKDKKLIDISIEATNAAAQALAGDRRATQYDTVAHLQALKGDLDAAIATSKSAIEIASPQGKKELLPFLNELEALKKRK